MIPPFPRKERYDKAFTDRAALMIVLAAAISIFVVALILGAVWFAAGLQGVLILIASCGLLWVAWVQVRQRL